MAPSPSSTSASAAATPAGDVSRSASADLVEPAAQAEPGEHHHRDEERPPQRRQESRARQSRSLTNAVRVG